MIILATRITSDIDSTKIIYEHLNKKYLSTGNTDFRDAREVKSLDSVLGTWGFREVSNPPTISSGAEVKQALVEGRFSVDNLGYVTYSG